MRLSKTAAFYLQASIIVSFLAGSAAPTPLYPVYQASWGFSPITITVIFGIYAVAVLAMLLVVGSLSDYVGRRPVLFAAALLQAATMGLFVAAHGVGTLLAARVVQGLATGSAAAAVGAGMVDIDRHKGTVANAVGPMVGTATGGLLSGLLVQYLPAPTKLVYLVLAGVFVLQAAGVAVMPESVARRPGALASLSPHFRLPAKVREPMLLAVPALVGAWSLVGFYGALGPMLVRRLSGSTSLALGGVVLFVLASSGAWTVLATRTRPPQVVMAFGMAALVAGVGTTLLALHSRSMTAFFAGLVIAGAGFGAGFQGAIRSVLLVAEPEERAGVLSIPYVAAYLAMGVPAVLGGLRLVHGHGLFATAQEYGLVVMSLAALALAGSVVRGVDLPAAGARLLRARRRPSSSLGA